MNGGSVNASDDAANATQRADSGVVTVPFVRASDEHLEAANVDVTRQLSASLQDLGTFNVPAYGYLRYLHVLVEATGGAQGAAVVAGKEDAPFNVLTNIQLTEPNGAYIVQANSGYELYLINKYGGYFKGSGYAADPKKSPAFSGIAATGNFAFLLVIPLEVSARDGVGSLPNQDAAGTFKLRLALAASSDVYATAPATTLPTVRVRAWFSAWDQPEVNAAGVVNQTSPPAEGTTSFWSVQSGITVNAGDNTIALTRKGNYLRQVIFVLRRGGTSRVNGQTDWPAETRFLRDAFPARYYNDIVWRDLMFKRTGLDAALDAAGGLDSGVRFHDYMHEFNGGLGNENRDLWQPTRGSTRLELAGSFANAGTLTVITNDVAIAQNVFL